MTLETQTETLASKSAPGFLRAAPAGAKGYRWLGLAVLTSGAISAAWLRADGQAEVIPWEPQAAAERLAECPEIEISFTAADGQDLATDRDEFLLRLRRGPNARWIQPVEAMAAWARHFTAAQRIWIMLANRHHCSAMEEINEEKFAYTSIPYAGTVMEFFSLVAAQCGWRQAEERLQWQSLTTSEAPELPAEFRGEGCAFAVHSGLEFVTRLPPEQRAAAAQRALEAQLIELFRAAQRQDAQRAFCLMGDFAHNALLVRALERAGIPVQTPFAAGQHGLALGAALAASGIGSDAPPSPFLGPAFSDEEIKETIDNCRLRAAWLNDAALLDLAAEEIAAQRILGWFQGPAELGPRALGARSILASPRMPYLRENLNLYVKNRELFRPFALSLPAEAAGEWVEAGSNCLYLASLAHPKGRLPEQIPELILPNGELRLHLVRERDNPLFHRLLWKAGEPGGIPALVQTSFNAPGEPIVATPRQALRTFYSHGMDTLLLGHWVLRK